MSVRRALTSLPVMLLLVLSAWPVAAQTPAAVAADKAITVVVDHEARTVTITVRIAFFVRGCREHPPGGAAPCSEQGRLQARSMISDLQSEWGGKSVKCYTLIVKIESKLVTGPQGKPDAIDVGLDFSSVPIGSALTTTGGSRPAPVNNPGTGATSWPTGGSEVGRSEISSSFGTMVGLGLSQVDQKKLRCDLKVDYTDASGMVWYGEKCNEPSGHWVLDISGKVGKVKWKGNVAFSLNSFNLEGDFTGLVIGSGPFNYKVSAAFSGTATMTMTVGKRPEMHLEGGSSASGSVTVPTRGTVGFATPYDSGGLVFTVFYGTFCH